MHAGRVGADDVPLAVSQHAFGDRLVEHTSQKKRNQFTRTYIKINGSQA